MRDAADEPTAGTAGTNEAGAPPAPNTDSAKPKRKRTPPPLYVGEMCDDGLHLIREPHPQGTATVPVVFTNVEAVARWAKGRYKDAELTELTLLRRTGTLTVGVRKQTVCRVSR